MQTKKVLSIILSYYIKQSFVASPLRVGRYSQEFKNFVGVFFLGISHGCQYNLVDEEWEQNVLFLSLTLPLTYSIALSKSFLLYFSFNTFLILFI